MLVSREDFVTMVEFFALRYKHLYTLYLVLFQIGALFSFTLQLRNALLALYEFPVYFVIHAA